MSKTTRILLIVLCCVCFGIAVFSGWKLVSTLMEYKRASDLNAELSSSYTSEAAQSNATQKTDAAGEGDQANEDPTSTEAQEQPGETSPKTVNFEELLKKNEDVVGWLYCEGTVLDYVVVQGEDNDEYLHHTINGDYNSSGTLFVDCQCAPEFAGSNTIVYGHNMKNGSMFYSLLNYREQSYYDAHPVIYLNTPTQNYRIDVFAGYICNYDSDTYHLSFPSEEDYMNYLTKMKSQSDFDCDVELSVTDRVITLSTCTYEYDNARYVVQGKLVPLNG